ncbi:hypothetical protein TanjilG_00067 [Lupinus angustifolius]|uniref:Uncharacterized protein n=1 Tax=Lupinus angustifolius TaxID=3871 RepID=A0A394CZM5_LUPAN|nr:PREDICTED: uncharacterized protein LOC109336878 [Lupinus angustifolius]OIW16644.1 hypothetical protein TanjilG_00067 [Lupinus angustifolius]
MGSAFEIGIKIRKAVVISIRGCYRSVCNHPFLVCFLWFLLLLYRHFPFLFSLLVSASPVLICTAVLLGTLLSFGQPNVPEIEKEENVTHSISSFQTGFSEGDTIVADRDESYFVKGYSEYTNDVEESGIDEASLEGERDNSGEEVRGLLSDVLVDDENLEDVQPEKPVKEEVEREFRNFELGERSREVCEENLRSGGVSSDEEAIDKQYVLVEKVNDDNENEKTPGDWVDFSASSSWKRMEKNDDDDDEEEEEELKEDSVESGSDQAESSSPDASMADIMPMLDELHPLLDLDAPRPAHMSRDGSDAASEKSQKSDDDSIESDEEDAENRGEVEEDGVDERDDEEEEEMEGGKEDESKSAIKWTEDDQRNLLDLRSLELERNQRLENLIARRRAMRLMVEKNLIDLDSADIPINVAPIAMPRRNPFDFPDESYADMGLPPIPGSAPSILQPRQNPFDIPYDPSEEKTDLKGDDFQQEITMFTQKDKDTIFRRHESFSMGPSVLGMSKHERHDINWKPVFVTESMASEGTSYTSFQRQSSEVSDSKMSSVPDTESVSSVDQDERKFSEKDLSQEAELISNNDIASNGGPEHGSQSSGENDSVEMIKVEESNVHPDEVEILLGGVENPTEKQFYPETEGVKIHEQLNAGETHSIREPTDEDYSSRSSRSSLSEVIDNILDETTKKKEILKQEDGEVGESGISTHASVEESIFEQMSGEVQEIQHVDPVYDSSPPGAGKLHSFPSVSSDSATEFYERSLPPVSVEMSDDVADKESELHDQRLEGNTSGNEETQGASSQLHMEVINELRSEKSEDINQHNVSGDVLSAVATNFLDQNVSTMAKGLPSDIESVEDVTNSGLVHNQDLADHISADSEIIPQQNVDSPDSNHQTDSEKSLLSGNETVEEGAVPNEISRFHSANMSEFVQDSDGTKHVEKVSPDKEDIYQIEHDKVVLSSSMEQDNHDTHHDLDKNMDSLTSDSHHKVDVESSSNLENHLSNSDKLVAEPSSTDHHESLVDSAQGFGTANDGAEELHDVIDKVPLSVSSVTSETSDIPEFSSTPREVDLAADRQPENETEDQNEAVERLDPSAEDMSQVTEENIKEHDDIKEIDEEFLSELDTVGDFSVGDANISLRTDIVDDKIVDTQGNSLPNDVNTAEVEQDIPVLEARSLEDINLDFKQLQEGVGDKEAGLPSSVKDQLVSEESKDHAEVNSDLQVIEGRSMEDTNTSFNQIIEGNHGELPKLLDLKDGSAKIEQNDVGSTKVIENIDAATIADDLSKISVDKPENAHVSGLS